MAIALYALVVAIYLLWERRVKRRRNAGRRKGYNPFKAAPTEDIIGKSKFTLRQGWTKATDLIISDKGEENPSTFANGNRQTDVQNTPAAVHNSDVETEGLPEASGDISGEIDLVINDEPEGGIEPDYDDGLNHEETEAEDEDEPTGGGIAQGLGFDDLAGATRTVENAETASPQEREEAGRVLAEVRKTELIGQIAPDEPKKKIVSALMDEYLSAHYRNREAQPQPTVKAPADFNIRGLA